MANLKDIKRRIGTVKNTGKITQAMKLVSAAKFARASHAVAASRPFSETFGEVVAKVVSTGLSEDDSVLLRQSEEKKSLIIAIATDRGLCGSLNSNLFKTLDKFFADKKAKNVDVSVMAWGRRAASYANKLDGVTVIEEKEKVLDKPTYAEAKAASNKIIEQFSAGEFDTVYVAFNEFESAMAQEPKVAALLPVTIDAEETTATSGDVIMEPEKSELLPSLLEKKVGFQVFQSLLDAAASEHGARMSAMDSATRNSKEVEKKLTVQYNRARQAAITKELIEIVSGAEAL